MTARALFLVLRAYAAVLLASSLGLVLWLRVDRGPVAPAYSVVSVWEGGVRRGRALAKGDGAAQAVPIHRGQTRVIEDVLDDSPVLFTSPVLFGASFVAAEDGIQARYGDRVAVASVDDLIKLRAFDVIVPFGTTKLKLAVDAPAAQAFLAKELGVEPEELLAHGRFFRLAMRRRESKPPVREVTRENLRASAIAAGRYLARAVQTDGRYRYETDGATAETTPDYNWPRHCGATWFLAEATAYSHDPTMQQALALAARRLSQGALTDCGEHRCIAEGDRADLGSSALGLLALVETVEAGMLPELRQPIAELAEFLRSMQRPDGEFQHLYDRRERHPIDVQLLYYTGEAALALSRAARLTGDQRNFEAARAALSHLVRRPWWFVAGHYLFGSEHWTCHALADLWDCAPDPEALGFCLEWEEAVRNLGIEGREASSDFDGATGNGPFMPPSLVGSSTRMEAAVSTLRTARRAGVSASELAHLESGLEHTLAFLLRFQFTPGPAHLMPNPNQMYGGFPATPVDFKVRIDYPQHAGTAVLGYLKLLEGARQRE